MIPNNEKIRDFTKTHICVVCGKPIKENEDYFISDMIGYFCEKCMKSINNASSGYIDAKDL